MLCFIVQLGGFFIRLNFLYGFVSNELVEQLQEGGPVYGQIILPENFMLHILDIVAGALGGVGPLINSQKEDVGGIQQGELAIQPVLVIFLYPQPWFGYALQCLRVEYTKGRISQHNIPGVEPATSGVLNFFIAAPQG